MIAIPQLTAPAIAEVIAGPIENPSNGHLYYAVSRNTWTGAEAEAQSLGGHLVTINDEDENNWVWETFAPLIGGLLWIGLNDAEQEGTFVWSSGEPTSYFNWWCRSETDCEPNNANGAEDYVEMNNYVWNDNINERPFIGIVEIKEEQQPTPTEVIEKLISDVENLEGIPEGAKTRIVALLERALVLLSDDNTRNDASACNMIGTPFMNQINANERQDTLTEDQSYRPKNTS